MEIDNHSSRGKTIAAGKYHHYILKISGWKGDEKEDVNIALQYVFHKIAILIPRKQ